MSNQGEVDHEEFFRYTSGRWLWNEEGRLAERYRWFNVDELKKIAVASAEARQCVSMVKLAEGASNKVFRLVMDNGSAVIARIPNPATGQPGLTMASEVATMDFVSWFCIFLCVNCTLLTNRCQGQINIKNSRSQSISMERTRRQYRRFGVYDH